MVFVTVGQHHEIDVAVPEPGTVIQKAQGSARCRTSVDKDTLACGTFDEDGVSLTHIQKCDMQPAITAGLGP